jgi:VanZ family protein
MKWNNYITAVLKRLDDNWTSHAVSRRGAIPVQKLRPVWLTIGWALIALVVYLSLKSGWLPLDALGGNESMHRFSYRVSHALAYGTLMLWFLQLYPVSRRPLIAIGFLLLGAALEGLQGLTPDRDPSVVDIVADTIGIGIGWLLGKTRLSRMLTRIETRILRLKI